MTSLFEEISPEPAAGVPVRRVTFSLNGDATWNPLGWLWDFRGNRVGVMLRPEIPS